MICFLEYFLILYCSFDKLEMDLSTWIDSPWVDTSI